MSQNGQTHFKNLAENGGFLWALSGSFIWAFVNPLVE